MEIIACIFIDKHGHIKYVPQYFKPKECDICISNFEMKDIGNKTLYYVLLDYREEYKEDICWTIKETLRRCNELEAKKIKIFTRIQDFYDNITELQFAYIDELDEWDEELDMNDLKEFCKKTKREYLGELKNIKFFKYTVDKK